jgi:hypothetical protein
MPIAIQELLAADTLSQAVNKINFNFDQLLLNGGGPVGPAGIPGPTGPAGGRGLKGATWYTGGVNPNTLIIPGIEDGDYFLQANGDVWEYNGTVWILTTVNLKGPTGSTGSSVGFDYIGGYNGPNPPASLNNENVAFPVPMPAGVSGGANQLTNQGVSTVLLGGVGSTVNPPAGITYSSAFQIPNGIATQLDASLVSVLVHQKDSSSSAIRFMGGGDITAEKYEQVSLSNLSNISLGVDDTLDFNVPKAATSPTGLFELIGLNLNTIRRGQQFYAGKQINLISGADPISSGLAGEISDITLTINTSNSSIPAKFAVATTFASATALFEVGGNISIPTSTTRTGLALIEANNIGLVGGRIRLRSSNGHGLDIQPASVLLSGQTGPVTITTGNANDIYLDSINDVIIYAVSLIDIASSAVTINGSSTINLTGTGNVHQLTLDNGSTTLGGTKLKGNVIWNATSLANPLVTTHRNISINKGSLAAGNSPVYIGHNLIGSGQSLMLDAFKGLTQATAIEYTRIYTASTDIRNTSGNAGFVGHTVENTSVGMTAANVGFRLRGVDRSGGNQAVATKFHASEDTTAVYNRMQYVRRVIAIDPLFAGIQTSAAIGYTVPSTAMDATFLDIIIAHQGVTLVDNGVSDDDWILYIPNGSYVGQRLIVHVIARGGIVPDPSGVGTRFWPSSSGGSVEIRCRQGGAGAVGTFQKIGTMVVTGSFGIYTGSEFFIELLWVGTTYSTYSGNPTSSFLYRNSGWLITNGTNKIDADNGEYEAVQNNQTWS